MIKRWQFLILLVIIYPSLSRAQKITDLGDSIELGQSGCEYNDKYYFYGRLKSGKFGLIQSDGTKKGTKVFSSNVDQTDYGLSSYAVFDCVVLAGKLYFSGVDAEHGREVWESDGTAAGTKLFYDYQAGSIDGLDSQITSKNISIIKGKLLVRMSIMSRDGRRQFWTYSPESKDIKSIDTDKFGNDYYQDANSYLFRLGDSDNDLILFSGATTRDYTNDGRSLGVRLYISDGTKEGTYDLGNGHVLKSLDPKSTFIPYDNFQFLTRTSIGGIDPKLIAFSNYYQYAEELVSYSTQPEIWVSNGTLESTKLTTKLQTSTFFGTVKILGSGLLPDGRLFYLEAQESKKGQVVKAFIYDPKTGVVSPAKYQRGVRQLRKADRTGPGNSFDGGDPYNGGLFASMNINGNSTFDGQFYGEITAVGDELRFRKVIQGDMNSSFVQNGKLIVYSTNVGKKGGVFVINGRRGKPRKIFPEDLRIAGKAYGIVQAYPWKNSLFVKLQKNGPTRVGTRASFRLVRVEM
jgi:ELWxxDGT repeat protein